MNVNDLNLAEQQLISKVEQVTGLMEEKGDQLLNNGVYADYRKIYENYVALIDLNGEGLEALKRALFLTWYEQAEPSCFSGLYGLPENLSRKVFESLERKVTIEELDFELEWMLPYYKVRAEWVFLPYPDLPNLQLYLSRPTRKSSYANVVDFANLKAEDFNNRGQMGEYWLSIVNNSNAR